MNRPREHDVRLDQAIDVVFADSKMRGGIRGEIFPGSNPMLVREGFVGVRRDILQGQTQYRHVVPPGEIALPINTHDIVVLSPRAEVQIAPARLMRTVDAQLVLGASDRHRADQANDLGFQHTALEKVAWALHQLGETEPPLHQTDLALWTGISRGIVNRQFRELRIRGIIVKNTIVDLQALEPLYQH